VRFNQQQAKPALRSSQCAPPNWPVSSGRKHTHCANPHSNNRSTQTNPTISRLSASPTPSNDPRYTNVTHGVRETYTYEKPTPNRTLAAISNAAAQPVIAAIRAERSILSAQTSVCGQSTILLRLTNDCYRSKF
jgi:hypothetical protein